ncbi:hypothetical protein [Microvirga splendida]|uniref:Protein NO VEIN C-terminal domain-containing protein n=1 Tax=Microvirga splendida TaxID=2795727 RepID=A0ABS0Y6X0_9HYPH|nr:hypothetical protein [Microvirga splendida]MBJ6128033.1 hypothetical protein [Microvirga splendida]
MLRIAGKNEVKIVRDLLLGEFQNANPEIKQRRISSPGGAVTLDLHWLPQLGLWGHFSDRPYGELGQWNCAFGTSVGSENDTLYASIEINLAVDPADRVIAGRAIKDDTNGYYLGHKGLLGGGRGGQMSMEVFRKYIKGYVPEAIELENGKEEYVFVIGQLGQNGFLQKLKAFVDETERLRAYARTLTAQDPTPKSNSVSQSGGFTAENAQNGTGNGRPYSTIEIKRLHGRVVNALQKKLGQKAINSAYNDMRPDLYIKDTSGHMEILFEVKASSDTQSWFTALGQLLVYGASQPKPPHRILVCPAVRNDPNFRRALQDLNISVITFQESKEGIVFDGIGDLKKKHKFT